MNNPVYSTDLYKIEHEALRELVPQIITQEKVEMLNTIINIAPHGVFLFIQYQEKSFIVDGYPEQLFWNNIIRLYTLLHDCGQQTMDLFLRPRVEGGLATLDTYGSGEGINNSKFTAALSFIEDIEALRHYEAHNFKPDSKTDQLKIAHCKRWFRNVCKEEAPSNQFKWTSCNQYLVKSANEVLEILQLRLEYLEKYSSSLQKQILLEQYYEKIKVYFNASIFKAISDINKRYHLNMNEIQIKATIKSEGNDLIGDAINLLRGAFKRVDPYKALIETLTKALNKR